MKRIGIISIVLVLAILLTGCGKELEEVTNAKALIDGIEEIDFNSYEQIKTAREAFDSLSAEYQAKVKNIDKLEAAEKEYSELIQPVCEAIKAFSLKLKDPQSIRLYGEILWAPGTASSETADPLDYCSFVYDAKNSWGAYAESEVIEIVIKGETVGYFRKDDSAFLNALLDEGVRKQLEERVIFHPEIFSAEGVCKELGIEFIG